MNFRRTITRPATLVALANNFDKIKHLLAKEEIRDLVLQYSVAVAERDVDLMVSLFTRDADFGSSGSGPDGLRKLMKSTMNDMEFGIVFIANHSIEIIDDYHADGEVWAKGYAQNKNEGYYEQLVKYIDEYRREDGGEEGKSQWKFAKRNHQLWFGESKSSPLAQPPAAWPKSNIGIGRIPLADPLVQNFLKTLNSDSKQSGDHTI